MNILKHRGFESFNGGTEIFQLLLKISSLVLWRWTHFLWIWNDMRVCKLWQFIFGVNYDFFVVGHFVPLIYTISVGYIFQVGKYFNLYKVGTNIPHKLGFGTVTTHNTLTSFFVHFTFERWHVAASESGPGTQRTRSVLWDRFTASRSNTAQTNPGPVDTAWITTARSMSNLLPVLIMNKENFSGLQNPFWKCCHVQKQTQ